VGEKRRRAEYHLRKDGGRGKVYMTKSSGARIEPWGIPQEEV